MPKENKLLQRFVKVKKMQNLGNSLVVIIPKTWVKALKWDKKTDLKMSLNPDENKIMISETKSDAVSEVEIEENGEETGELVLA
jgi:antitoxin component of MazEF toxin-antitoxin module